VLRKSTHPAKVKNYQSLNVGYLPLPDEVPPESQERVRGWVEGRSPSERAIEIAQEAIDMLHQIQEMEDLSEQDRHSVYRSLARAYQARAYPLARMGRLMEAGEAHKACLDNARRGGLPATQSHALNDLAFNYARLGQWSVAESHAREGLRIRERLGLDYFVGLSLNTLGLIKFLGDKPHQGKAYSQRALDIFERLGNRRGIGLAHLALGQMDVRVGELEIGEESLKRAQEHLLKADEIFSDQVEPSRLPEVYERLGILYLVWGGRFLPRVGAEQSEIAEYLERADSHFERAVAGYGTQRNEWEQAIALERWARVDFDRCESARTEREDKACALKESEEKLNRAQSIALRRLGRGVTRQIKMETRHPEYRLVLGKVEMARGRIAFERFKEAQIEDEKDDHLRLAARHFTLSCAYLETFSPVARELQAALDLVDEQVRLLDVDQIRSFQGDVTTTQERYDIQEYRRLPDHLELIASFQETI
jgi:tetratricopeptide (TPR) repeat protein